MKYTETKNTPGMCGHNDIFLKTEIVQYFNSYRWSSTLISDEITGSRQDGKCG